MMRLAMALSAWGTSGFETVLKQEIARGADHLPLQQGLSRGNYVLDAPVTVAIHRITELENMIRISAGIFYQGVLGGCSCADDPTPVSTSDEYCEVRLDIDKSTAVAAVVLVE